ncbi:tetratricopeptide repeat protein [Thiocystis violacea]|uniref:tetratricopeptide repeat protein n=1 Tax=Thiocystis violacea TaxID=13725 RepID=UPI0019078CBA|nr:tetratricopeptide repeat protein [Thiocystis violacea]MBK1724036.1 hypothetical protein [Thiocystis violacea]
MEQSIKLLMICVALSTLTACATGVREGPPAPVVKVRPPPSAPAAAVEPRREPMPEAVPEPVREPAPKKKVAKPAKQGTTVYAYKDPSRAPDPEPTPQPTSTSGGPPLPGESAEGPGAQAGSTPAGPASPTAPVAGGGGGRPQTPPATPTQPGEQVVATADTKQQLPATPPPPPVSALPESTLAAPKLPPAAETLASQAEKQRQAGDYAGAAASLERSLRISPREPYLWNRLARVRMEQGQSAQAGNLASRSNDLAGQSPDVKKDNWRVIAESKRRAGDMAGASEAEKRAGQD